MSERASEQQSDRGERERERGNKVNNRERERWENEGEMEREGEGWILQGGEERREREEATR